MCFKKIWQWLTSPNIPPDIPGPLIGSKVALLFGIGEGYSGTNNDLIGPPYDLIHVYQFFKTNYPEFQVKTFADTSVTRNIFETAIKKQIEILKPGDNLVIYYTGHGTNGVHADEPDGYREGLYLTDGTYWDDEFTLLLQGISMGAKVTVVLDSCFAKGSTVHKILADKKFVQTQIIPPRTEQIKRILKSDSMNYVIYAACGENQTSADLGILGGAFTIYWLKAWDRSFTHLQWSSQTSKLLSADNSLDQVPNIDGDMDLMNQVIFS